ncbi:hypothetical protein HF995_13310 [Sanguibacter hominis ATCC BAA-789]|uniref:Uncharacterized protein n=1 Tax=Sanguibacter hominis ATCC BAA-789 TaxID=1312740 RepID=A0A9X5ISK4_9MICO|nr:hypothetical protein [Sanguibacter hominis]NKX94234.1 hypothetical protein [Sanguibacter hominis ATCC BAA-789]
MTDTEVISEIVAARTNLERAQAHLRDRVREAVALGRSVTEVAAAADVTRQTVYRWAEDTSRTLIVRDALDEALTLLATVIGPTHEPAVRALVGAGVEAQVAGTAVALASLTDTATTQLDARGRATVTTATRIVEAARAAHDATGTWPSTVTLD